MLNELTENALAVLQHRYLRKGTEGQPIEKVEEMFHRVASHVAAVEQTWGGDMETVEASFYDLMTSLRFLPNSPTFTGAGTPLGQLAACFVLPIDDDMGREGDGIFQTLRNVALIQQTGGGTGFSFSRLRPKGAPIRSSGGKATGPVSFLRLYDKASFIVSQGGVRRGANMAVLRVDHPDIFEFICSKSSEHALTTFNISVGITDAFIQAVNQDGKIDLVNPQDGKVWETVEARRLFGEIVKMAYHNGEPGVIFLDTINRDNPCSLLGQYEATNPCGEQPLLPYENCCLGSINLAQHVSSRNDDHQTLDWKKLQQTVEQSTHFLDNVVNANRYVPGVPQLEEAAHRTRRIGLGIMGFGDLLYCLEVRYGSNEAQELAAQVMEFIRYYAMHTSIELSRDRGPFPAIQGSVYDPDDLRWTPPQPIASYTQPERWKRPILDWKTITDGIRCYGIRNATQTTVAPTGTIATVSSCEAYGCEPVFALAYTRHVNDRGRNLDLRYTSPLFTRALERAELEKDTQDILQQVAITGSCQDIEEIPNSIRDVFVVASDISAEEHVRMQAAFQAFVDASISKTINFPCTAKPDDVAQAFQLAWNLGCKGLTVYVTGSREKVVIETEETKKAGQRPSKPMTTPLVLRPRKNRLTGTTYRRVTPLGTAYLTINDDDESEPFEVFLNVGKAGSDTAAVAEAIGRLISLNLRIPSPLSAKQRLGKVMTQLKGIGGGKPLGFGQDRVQSLPDGVALILAEHLGMFVQQNQEEEATQLSLFPVGDLCPECGQAALVNTEGCRRCYSCGHSEC